MGTPEFSAKIFEGLIADGYNIVGVITEPDKPFGRKKEITPPPVKLTADKLGIPVFQPEKKDAIPEILLKTNPDLAVVAAYGKIITKESLEVPRYGCINFHGSIVPKLRGASPIQTAILQGMKKTGVTIMKMDEGMDTGPVLSQVEIEIDEGETTSSLREKMLGSGLPLLLDTIGKYVDGTIEPKSQEGEASYTSIIKKEDGHIDFNKTAIEEERKLRAFDEWPGVYAFWGDKRIKILGVEVAFDTKSSDYKNGQVFLDENKNLCLKFEDGHWIIKSLQLEGKKEMSSKDFLNGNRDIIGNILQ